MSWTNLCVDFKLRKARKGGSYTWHCLYSSLPPTNLPTPNKGTPLSGRDHLSRGATHPPRLSVKIFFSRLDVCVCALVYFLLYLDGGMLFYHYVFGFSEWEFHDFSKAVSKRF
ncbi:unnamed protein product [Amoebophrya sp. A25]|nr:unnamed protein product [Amoebophrya sp. A25]|eukprot:GSA25T00022023001.1